MGEGERVFEKFRVGDLTLPYGCGLEYKPSTVEDTGVLSSLCNDVQEWIQIVKVRGKWFPSDEFYFVTETDIAKWNKEYREDLADVKELLESEGRYFEAWEYEKLLEDFNANTD